MGELCDFIAVYWISMVFDVYKPCIDHAELGG